MPLNLKNQPQNRKKTYNFNFTVGRAVSKTFGGFVACVILLMCIIQLYFNPSTRIGVGMGPKITEPIVEPMVKYAKSDIRPIMEIYNSLKERIKKPHIPKTDQFSSKNYSNLTHVEERVNNKFYLTSLCENENSH